jgi:putative transposase
VFWLPRRVVRLRACGYLSPCLKAGAFRRISVTGARITRTADWWFISITIEVPDERTEKRHTAVGIDVGLNRLATLSTGEGYENQAFLKTALKKLRQANKRLHRRKPGSKNREKARRQVARLHYRITCMRDDVLHKLTTRIAQCYGIIGIEDLNPKGLLKNRRLSRSFSDAGARANCWICSPTKSSSVVGK